MLLGVGLTGSGDVNAAGDTRTAAVSDSLPTDGDEKSGCLKTAVNGKLTDDSEHFVEITPVHMKLSKSVYTNV